jgi:hypothetical protein
MRLRFTISSHTLPSPSLITKRIRQDVTNCPHPPRRPRIPHLAHPILHHKSHLQIGLVRLHTPRPRNFTLRRLLPPLRGHSPHGTTPQRRSDLLPCLTHSRSVLAARPEVHERMGASARLVARSQVHDSRPREGFLAHAEQAGDDDKEFGV